VPLPLDYSRPCLAQKSNSWAGIHLIVSMQPHTWHSRAGGAPLTALCGVCSKCTGTKTIHLALFSRERPLRPVSGGRDATAPATLSGCRGFVFLRPEGPSVAGSTLQAIGQPGLAEFASSSCVVAFWANHRPAFCVSGNPPELHAGFGFGVAAIRPRSPKIPHSSRDRIHGCTRIV
jgi:hypothetical protein